jgi:hypothetical protein
MDNKIVKRLMAAGASPQRARAFATQFQKSVQAKSPGANLKPRDYDDAFDDQLDAASRQMFPNVFRPPAVDDPQIDDYIEFLYPGQGQKIKERAYKFSAPTFLAAKTSTVPIEQMFTEAIEKGQSLGTLQTILASDAGLDVLGTLPLEDAQALAKKLFAEYGAAQEKLVTEREAFLKKDQNYKYGIPDPKLKYGATTNLKKGVVGIDTIPSVKPFVEKEMTKFSTARQANPTGIAPSSYMNPLENVLDMVNKKGLTPNKDEQQRRFNIKYNR